MIEDSDDEGPAPPTVSLPAAQFHADVQESDSLEPSLMLVQRIELPLSAAALVIAVPSIPSSLESSLTDTKPPIFAKKIVFAVACSDHTTRIITLPLAPPPHAAKVKSSGAIHTFGEEILSLPAHAGHQAVLRGLSIMWTRKMDASKSRTSDAMELDEDKGSKSEGRLRSPRKRTGQVQAPQYDVNSEYVLHLASTSTEAGGSVRIWQLELGQSSVILPNPILPLRTILLDDAPVQIIYSPVQNSPSQLYLLIIVASGLALVYDPLGTQVHAQSENKPKTGGIIAVYRTSFQPLRGQLPLPSICAARKSVLGASWTPDGRSILVLLSDGEWGIWDLPDSSSKSVAEPVKFKIGGFVGTNDPDRGAEGYTRSGNRSSLAPMTPNTRRRKEDVLFHGSTSGTGTTLSGGVSISRSTTTTSAISAQEHETVIIWYGPDVFRIPDLRKYRSKSESSKSRQIEIMQISNLTLHQESISSIDQLPADTQKAHSSISRGLLIAAEHRLILTNPNDRFNAGEDIADSMGMDAHTTASKFEMTDQALLSRGELSLNGMNRLLGSMEKSASDPQSILPGSPRKVLFTTSNA